MPASWPGIADYIQNDYQALYPHPGWQETDLVHVTAAWYQCEILGQSTRWEGFALQRAKLRPTREAGLRIIDAHLHLWSHDKDRYLDIAWHLTALPCTAASEGHPQPWSATGRTNAICS